MPSRFYGTTSNALKIMEPLNLMLKTGEYIFALAYLVHYLYGVNRTMIGTFCLANMSFTFAQESISHYARKYLVLPCHPSIDHIDPFMLATTRKY